MGPTLKSYQPDEPMRWSNAAIMRDNLLAWHQASNRRVSNRARKQTELTLASRRPHVTRERFPHHTPRRRRLRSGIPKVQHRSKLSAHPLCCIAIVVDQYDAWIKVVAERDALGRDTRPANFARRGWGEYPRSSVCVRLKPPLNSRPQFRA